MSGFWILAWESLQDAIRRRLAFAVAALSVLSVVFLDGCIACVPTQVEVNGVQTELGAVASSAAGAVTLIALGLWMFVLAGVLAADHLSQSLEDGTAMLALSRPVSRAAFALSRLAGALVVAFGAGALLFGAATFFLSGRHGLPTAPALEAAGVAAWGGLLVAAWAMAASLLLPRTLVLLGILVGIVGVALANGFGLFQPLSGLWGLVDRFGPPLLDALILPLRVLLPEELPFELRLEPFDVMLRMSLWTIAGLMAIALGFRRLEIR